MFESLSKWFLNAKVVVQENSVVKGVVISLVLFLVTAFLASAVFAADCGTQVPSVKKNCTDNACTVTACWSTAQASMTSCNLYIVTPSGALPAVSGAVNSTKDLCTITMPKLVTGTHSLTAKGVGEFGEGPANATPLALSTGTTPGAASSLAVR